MRVRRSFAIVFLMLVAFTAHVVSAQEQAGDVPLPPLPDGRSPAGEPNPQAGPGIAPAELAAFVDGVVRAYMERDRIAGVGVAVVDRSHDLLVRGYGEAAFDPVRGIDPADTLFRIGSVSKTFTYVSAMQLIEQGRLDPEAEANRYLPATLKLPDDGYPPVLVRHLLTHNAGYEDSALGHLFLFSPERVGTLDGYLARHRPQRVRPPDLHAVYSNYSVALLGAIIAQVSGEPFEAYVERHLLTPLAMSHTTFREPLVAGDTRRVAATFENSWSDGFVRKNGAYVAKPFEFIGQLAPAGAASSTAADMARWLRMLLGGGEIDGARVLKPETFAELARVNFRNADAVGGIAHGFFRERYGHYESLEHGGATLWFHSNLVVLPDAGLGVFVSTNTDSGRRLARELPRLVFEHLLEGARPVAASQPAADFAARAAEYAGSYLSERRNFSTLEKLFGVFDGGVRIAPTDDGHLLVDAGDGNTQRYVEESAQSFRSLDSGNRIAFTRDQNGRVDGFASAYGHNFMQRVGLVDAPATLALAVAALGVACLGVLLCAWRRSALPARSRIREGRVSAVLLMLAAAAWLALFVFSAIALLELAEAGGAVVANYPTSLLRMSVFGAWAVAGLSVLCALLLAAVLPARGWSIWRKLRHVGVVVLMLVVVALFVRWNILFAPLALGA
jgi:CubicO group peptidase (beta-lactamase class C family)